MNRPLPTRNPAIDVVKGILILLVIAGHLIPGSLADSFARHLIYGFHMPLFIGLAGYLFPSTSVAIASLSEIVKRYRLRLVLPWTIAVIAYFMLREPFSLSGLGWSFLKPFYHLWFVPAFCFWVALSWMGLRLRMSFVQIFGAGLTLSVLIWAVLATADASGYTGIILNVTRPQYYAFFALGMLLRHTPPHKYAVYQLIAILGLSVHVALFGREVIWVQGVNFFVFNLALLAATVNWIEQGRSSQKFLEWIGVHSLALYLWHMLPVLWARTFLPDTDLYYQTGVAGLVLLFVAYAVLSRIPFMRQYFFGLPKAKL